MDVVATNSGQLSAWLISDLVEDEEADTIRLILLAQIASLASLLSG